MSLSLLGGLALLTLGQTLHIVLADHAHRYCTEHNRIEDVTIPMGQVAGRESAGTPTFQLPDTGLHAPCAVLNADISRKPMLVGAEGAGLHPAPVATRMYALSTPLRAALDLIFLAPKNSPPPFCA